ncbi:MAG TPA: helix-turn-helix transcriptional regulator, partial [Telluria sp.]|nr:helix-turn-helix transcriptional regulator [Telluria sp.]
MQILTHTGAQPGHSDPTAERTVRPCARDLQEHDALLPHRHPWGQLTFTLSGVLRVTAGRSSWVVPPQRAIWIPADVEHAIVVLEPAQLRPLKVHASRLPFPDAECRVLEVSDLLRAAIVALGEADSAHGTPREALLSELILDEITHAVTTPIRVPLPDDKRLRSLCAALMADPGSTLTLAEWAPQVGASERTLARLFERELGMSFGAWRQQARLAHAAPLIARGMPLAQVASELG